MVLQLRLSTRKSFFGVRLLDYEAAYRAGYGGFHNYPGKPYEEIESRFGAQLRTQQGRLGIALGSCPTCRARSLGQIEPRHRAARSPPRNPQRDPISRAGA